MFRVNEKYSRNDVYRVVNVPPDKRHGNWETGYNQYNNIYYIFVNIGTEGRTGHDYNNYWIGNKLYWKAKINSKLSHPSIQKLLNKNTIVHIFTRKDSKNVNFTYQGLGQACSYEDTQPVTIIWEFNKESENTGDRSPNEINNRDKKYYEGALQKIFVNKYERDKGAREDCLQHYGYKCMACGMNFGKVYGEQFNDFIHVHHLVPLSEINKEYIVDPINDLVPVCPNCHAIIHKKKPPYSIGDIKKMINR